MFFIWSNMPLHIQIIMKQCIKSFCDLLSNPSLHLTQFYLSQHILLQFILNKHLQIFLLQVHQSFVSFTLNVIFKCFLLILYQFELVANSLEFLLYFITKGCKLIIDSVTVLSIQIRWYFIRFLSMGHVCLKVFNCFYKGNKTIP